MKKVIRDLQCVGLGISSLLILLLLISSPTFSGLMLVGSTTVTSSSLFYVSSDYNNSIQSAAAQESSEQETSEEDSDTGDDEETSEEDSDTGDDEETSEEDSDTGDDEETSEEDSDTGDDEETSEEDSDTGDDEETEDTAISTREICEDGIDNDHDGLVDIDDSEDCSSTFRQQEKEPVEEQPTGTTSGEQPPAGAPPGQNDTGNFTPNLGEEEIVEPATSYCDPRVGPCDPGTEPPNPSDPEYNLDDYYELRDKALEEYNGCLVQGSQDCEYKEPPKPTQDPGEEEIPDPSAADDNCHPLGIPLDGLHPRYCTPEECDQLGTCATDSNKDEPCDPSLTRSSYTPFNRLTSVFYVPVQGNICDENDPNRNNQCDPGDVTCVDPPEERNQCGVTMSCPDIIPEDTDIPDDDTGGRGASGQGRDVGSGGSSGYLREERFKEWQRERQALMDEKFKQMIEGSEQIPRMKPDYRTDAQRAFDNMDPVEKMRAEGQMMQGFFAGNAAAQCYNCTPYDRYQAMTFGNQMGEAAGEAAGMMGGYDYKGNPNRPDHQLNKLIQQHAPGARGR